MAKRPRDRDSGYGDSGRAKRTKVSFPTITNRKRGREDPGRDVDLDAKRLRLTAHPVEILARVGGRGAPGGPRRWKCKFDSTDPISRVFEWVRRLCVPRDCKFELIGPDRAHLRDCSATLFDVGLTSARESIIVMCPEPGYE